MITAKFEPGTECLKVGGLWQYDRGQRLRVEGLGLTGTLAVDFSLSSKGGEAIPVACVPKDGLAEVAIPDCLLAAGRDKDYAIYAYIYRSTATQGETTEMVVMTVKARPPRQGIAAPEAPNQFGEAIEAVQDAASRAEYAMAMAEADIGETRALIGETRDYVEAEKASFAGYSKRESDSIYANALIGNAGGAGQVTIEDAWNAPVAGLGISGASRQYASTGAQLLDTFAMEGISAGENVIFAVQDDGAILVTGNTAATGATANSKEVALNLMPGTYCVSGSHGGCNVVVKVTSSDGTVGWRINKLFDIDGTESAITGYVQAQANRNIHSIITPMLNAGSEPLPYEPYTSGQPSPSPDRPQEIRSVGDGGSLEIALRSKNLFDKNALLPYPSSVDKISIVLKDENSICITTTSETAYACAYVPVRLKPFTTYTFSGGIYLPKTKSIFGIRKSTDGGKTYIPEMIKSITVETTSIGLSRAFTTDENECYAVCLFATSAGAEAGNTTFSNIQLEEGGTATAWEPFQATVSAIPLTEPLRGIGDVRDTICCKEGIWGVERRIKKVVFEGASISKVFDFPEVSHLFYISDAELYKGTGITCISSHYMVVENGTTQSHGNQDKVVYMSSNMSEAIGPRIYMKDSRFGTTGEYRGYLTDCAEAGSPVIVYAQAGESVFEPFPTEIQPGINALDTFAGTTVAEVTSDGPEAGISIDYVQDTYKVITGLQLDIAEQITDLQAQIDQFTISNNLN